MATCASCGTTILFGGKKIGDKRFCDAKCVARGQALIAADQIPANDVAEFARRVKMGPCPKCQGPGPVDVHNAYSVYSVIVMTSWRTVPHVACDSCGSKAQFKALMTSVVAGWWGFPWGLLMTPIQIGRNIAAMRKDRSPVEPSEELLRVARLTLAARMFRASQPPPPPKV